MAGAAFDRAVNLAIAVRQELHPSERSRQLRFHDNPAWQAGLDFNAQDHSVLSLIEPGHEPMDVIAKDKISHFQLGSPLIISIELRIDDHHGGRLVDWFAIPHNDSFDLAVVHRLAHPDELLPRR
jgi:hypothetical protein